MQSRMARAALRWSVRDTAAKASVSINTLSRFENGGGVFLSTANRLRTTYEAAGVVLVDAHSCQLPYQAAA